MTRRQEVLGSLLKRLHGFSLDAFEKRLVFQKTVYFLQVFGLYFGYAFNWYIYGPYSPELTKDGYDIKESFDKLTPVHFTNADIENKLDQVKRFLSAVGVAPRKLELLASLHFLRLLNKNISDEQIIEKVRNKQTSFSSQECRQGIELLKKWNLWRNNAGVPKC